MEAYFNEEQVMHVHTIVHVQAVVHPPVAHEPAESDEQPFVEPSRTEAKPRIAGHPNTANATAKPKASASMAESTMYPGKRFAGGMGTSGAIGQMCGPTTKAVRPITIVTMSIHHGLLMIFISLNLLQLQVHGLTP
jgi:hypothetical protein